MRRYRVWSLDVWGHGSKDCCEAYGCPCVSVTGDDESSEEAHDDDKCDAEYSVNDRCDVGELETGDLEDATLTQALIDCGYLKDHIEASQLTFDGDEELIMVDDASDGRPLFQLEEITS